MFKKKYLGILYFVLNSASAYDLGKFASAVQQNFTVYEMAECSVLFRNVRADIGDSKLNVPQVGTVAARNSDYLQAMDAVIELLIMTGTFTLEHFVAEQSKIPKTHLSLEPVVSLKKSEACIAKLDISAKAGVDSVATKDPIEIHNSNVNRLRDMIVLEDKGATLVVADGGCTFKLHKRSGDRKSVLIIYDEVFYWGRVTQVSYDRTMNFRTEDSSRNKFLSWMAETHPFAVKALSETGSEYYSMTSRRESDSQQTFRFIREAGLHIPRTVHTNDKLFAFKTEEQAKEMRDLVVAVARHCS
jgi:hypothetical protein